MPEKESANYTFNDSLDDFSDRTTVAIILRVDKRKKERKKN